MLLRIGENAEYFDAVRAGDWLYCKSSWIGGGMCDGEWFGTGDERTRGTGVRNTKIPQLSPNGIFARSRRQRVRAIIESLSNRLRHVSICSGDWQRVFFPSLIQKHTTGIFLDPPYGYSTGRCENLYRVEKVANADVAEFCKRMGRSSNVRIVLAGLEGEYNLPGWRIIPWSAGHCFSKPTNDASRHKERLWLSPHCLPVTAPIRVATNHPKSARWRGRAEGPHIAPRLRVPRPSKPIR